MSPNNRHNAYSPQHRSPLSGGSPSAFAPRSDGKAWHAGRAKSPKYGGDPIRANPRPGTKADARISAGRIGIAL